VQAFASPLTTSVEEWRPKLTQRVQEMILKERACCAFLTFEMREHADEVWLSIKAPEEARPTADALFEPFLPRNSEA